MKAAQQLHDELSHWRRQVRCCGVIVFKYEPGTTFCECRGCGRKIAKPDWCPEEVAKEWIETNSSK